MCQCQVFLRFQISVHFSLLPSQEDLLLDVMQLMKYVTLLYIPRSSSFLPPKFESMIKFYTHIKSVQNNWMYCFVFALQHFGLSRNQDKERYLKNGPAIPKIFSHKNVQCLRKNCTQCMSPTKCLCVIKGTCRPLTLGTSSVETVLGISPKSFSHLLVLPKQKRGGTFSVGSCWNLMR